MANRTTGKGRMKDKTFEGTVDLSQWKWSLEQARRKGYDEGYTQGGADMRRALGTTEDRREPVGETRPKEDCQGERPEDEGKEVGVRDSEGDICTHTGEEDASGRWSWSEDCPKSPISRLSSPLFEHDLKDWARLKH